MQITVNRPQLWRTFICLYILHISQNHFHLAPNCQDMDMDMVSLNKKLHLKFDAAGKWAGIIM